jgi:hypothetical protein
MMATVMKITITGKAYSIWSSSEGLSANGAPTPPRRGIRETAEGQVNHANESGFKCRDVLR